MLLRALFPAAALVVFGALGAHGQTVTPYSPGPQPQLQSGLAHLQPSQLQSNTTYLGNSGLRSGITSIQNPASENTLVRPPSFNLGGVATVPGGDTATNSTNSTNATSATSGRGYSAR